MFDSDEEDEPQSKETPLLGQKGQSADRQRHASPIEEVFGASDDDEDSTLDTSGMRDPFLDDDEETEVSEFNSSTSGDVTIHNYMYMYIKFIT